MNHTRYRTCVVSNGPGSIGVFDDHIGHRFRGRFMEGSLNAGLGGGYVTTIQDDGLDDIAMIREMQAMIGCVENLRNR